MITKIDKKELKNLEIRYNFIDSQFGNLLVAKTEIGICCLGFVKDSEDLAILRLKSAFQGSKCIKDTDIKIDLSKKYHFHLLGTDFAIAVWMELLNIPCGKTITYGEIARNIGKNNAYRAVGTAISKNHVMLLIPCHRVIRSDGEIGEYAFGSEMKATILEYERLK